MFVVFVCVLMCCDVFMMCVVVWWMWMCVCCVIEMMCGCDVC